MSSLPEKQLTGKSDHLLNGYVNNMHNIGTSIYLSLIITTYNEKNLSLESTHVCEGANKLLPSVLNNIQPDLFICWVSFHDHFLFSKRGYFICITSFHVNNDFLTGLFFICYKNKLHTGYNI